MPASLASQCPHCRKTLKVKDPSLLGKKVKCPGCGQAFILQQNDAKGTPIEPKPGPPAGLEQTGVWTPATAGKPTPASEKAVTPSISSQPAGAYPAPTESTATESPAIEFKPPSVEDSPFSLKLDVPVASGAAELQRLRRGRKKSSLIPLLVVVACCGLAGAVYAFWIHPQLSAPTASPAGVSVESATAEAPGQDVSAGQRSYSKAELAQDAALRDSFSPTGGEPIQLFMMPSGVSLVVHLRPAELFSENYDARVLRASLTDEFAGWISTQVQQLTQRPPEEVDELTLGYIFGSRGSEPGVCAVFRYRSPQRLSALLEMFPGRPLAAEGDSFAGPRIRVQDTRATLIHDERTIASCPAEYAGELAEWINSPNPEISESLALLLNQTDRQRLVTIAGRREDVLVHLDKLAPGPARPLVAAVAEWLGDDVEASLWSVHPWPYLHTQFSLMPISATPAARLQSDFEAKLSALPERVWKDVCARLAPNEVRLRTLIGRLPAMLAAVQLATVPARVGRAVEFTAVLPAKAAPNLALATLFTLHEVDHAEAPSKPSLAATNVASNQSVLEKLRQVVDAEFNRTPLEQAVQYLCDECRVKLVIDGDALKDAGYTKNMPQTMTLGKVPAADALAAILANYQEPGKEMVVSLDDASQTLTLLTAKFAQQKGLPIHRFSK